MRTVIRGGEVVTATEVARADVLIVDEMIHEVGEITAVAGDNVIDATDSYVLPGGVDPHTHVNTVFRGRRTRDDYLSGATAAACGGTTCIIDFCFPNPGEPLLDSIARWREGYEAASPVIDAGVHLVLVQPDDDTLSQLPGIVDQGVTSVKLYMAYRGRTMTEDDRLFRTMQVAAESDIMVVLHAESGAVIDVLIGQALAAGHVTPIWHARTRPTLTESEAVQRALSLAQIARAKLYFVHLTCRESVEALAAAQGGGAKAWGETCPHYLLLDERHLQGSTPAAAGFVCSPPLRSVEHQSALWRGLAEGILSVVASDHCPYDLRSDKIRGPDFTQIMNGLPGIEQRISLLHHFGVRSGRLSMPQLVELTATGPARLFGLSRKGRLARGCDADVVIFNPNRSLRFSAATHHSAVDYDPYEGIDVVGAPELVLVRGRRVVDSGEPVSQTHGAGRFVFRRLDDALVAEPERASS